MNASTATPREIDEKLAELYREERATAHSRTEKVEALHRLLGERPTYVSRSRRTWPTSTVEAIEKGRVLAATDTVTPGHYSSTPARHAADAIRKLDAIDARLAEIRAEAAPLNAEYARRPWSRFFLVTSSNGHIHSSMNCSTCHVTTAYGWLPALSGKTEADAVADQGTRLCSVCFPSAPVEWTLGLAPTKTYCAGGAAVSGSQKRVGDRFYGKCPTCASTELVTNSGTVRKHTPPKA